MYTFIVLIPLHMIFYMSLYLFNFASAFHRHNVTCGISHPLGSSSPFNLFTSLLGRHVNGSSGSSFFILVPQKGVRVFFFIQGSE